MTAELIAFVRARLAEREAKAKAVRDGSPWRYNPRKYWRSPGAADTEEAVFTGPAGPKAICIAGTGQVDHRESMARAAHIATNDPAWVLADVAAKRRILDEVVPQIEGMDRQIWSEWGVGDYPGCDDAVELVRLLALPDASHPDYRPEWKP